MPEKTGSKEKFSQHSSQDATVVNGLMESTLTSCRADSEASFKERNSMLSKLKANVECVVQSCQSRLTEVKSQYTKLLEEKDAVEAQKLEKISSLSQLSSLLDENNKAVAELEKIHEHLRQKGQKIKEREHEQSELSRLEEEGRSIDKACDDARRLLSSILAELQPKLLNA